MVGSGGRSTVDPDADWVERQDLDPEPSFRIHNTGFSPTVMFIIAENSRTTTKNDLFSCRPHPPPGRGGGGGGEGGGGEIGFLDGSPAHIFHHIGHWTNSSILLHTGRAEVLSSIYIVLSKFVCFYNTRSIFPKFLVFWNRSLPTWCVLYVCREGFLFLPCNN